MRPAQQVRSLALRRPNPDEYELVICSEQDRRLYRLNLNQIKLLAVAAVEAMADLSMEKIN